MQLDFNKEIVSVDEILPGLWLGNEAASQSEEFIKKQKIKLVINATRDIPSRFLGRIRYVRVPVDDPGSLAIYRENEEVEVMKSALPFLMEEILAARRERKNVLVHCHAGMQRSAIIVAAYLLFRGRVKTPEEAVEEVVKKRPIAFFGGRSVNFKRALRN